MGPATITVADLAGVVYSSGKVFDGLSTGRLDTENFLRSGSLDGITSRSDLALLEDLRDVAQFVIDHSGEPIDASYVRGANAQLTRSAALHPGMLRKESQQIGVRTRLGRHEPVALTDDALRQIIDRALCHDDWRESALDVFVQLAKAQPFEDGNKRTALFVANGVLIAADSDVTLTIPVDDSDSTVADEFNELLARAYVHGEDDGVKDLLRRRGFRPLESTP